MLSGRSAKCLARRCCGLLEGLGPKVGSVCLAGTQPLAVCPALVSTMVRMAPAPSLLQWGSMRSHAQRSCADGLGHSLCAVQFPRPPPGSTIYDTLENSVCPKHPFGWMLVHGMSKQRPDVAFELCWPWCSPRGIQCCALAVGGGPSGFTPGCPVVQYESTMMGLLRVKGMAALEVKFLDRCWTNCSEGALQVHVRQSRMRVWGAKMIRHRRSPQL